MQTIKTFIENILPEAALLSMIILGFLGTSWYSNLAYPSPAQQTLYASGIVTWTLTAIIAMYFATAYRNR